MSAQGEEVLIRPGGSRAGYWRDLWAYRELFAILAWRDVTVRYKQTVLGVLWTVLKPFLTMVVFTVIFGRLAGLPSHGVAYPVLVFAALLPWQFFAGAINECGVSLISNANLLTKVYFPRLIIPASSVAASLADFLVCCGIMAGLMVFYQVNPGWRLFWLPLYLGIACFASLGGGLLFAALSIRYRDFKHIVPFVVQFGLFVSPVGFSSTVVPEKWRLVYALNPMVAVIDGFRWSLAGNQPAVPLYALVLSLASTALLFLSGVWYFRRTERAFADEI
ncbi:ABC transporter permease [Geomonas oryzae]|uniref:ABC transporter permease n=1 Tax=Geomonas oryzae TaxID=2364273 RepID=UPI00100B4062|nr:ABC transporter permease [Geomonas oryzae]